MRALFVYARDIPMSKKNLVFTGGGSGGHVMPALTIIKKINQNSEYNIHYIGGIKSIERELVVDYNLTYHPIRTGKLRRYLSDRKSVV